MISTKNNSPQPKTMTWAKALPILSISIVFDSLRLMFSMFLFFGPIIAGIATSEALGGGALGKAVGVAVAGATGFFGGGMLEMFGVIMAMAVGFIGWLTVGLLLILTNARIFKENIGSALRFVFSLLISEIPIVGGLPALTGITGSMYYSQIKKEKAALKKWEKEQSAKQIQERNLRNAQLVQISAAKQAQAMQQEEQMADEDMEQDEQQEMAPVYRPAVRPETILPTPQLAAVPNYTETVNTSRRNFLKQAGALAGSSVIGAYPSAFAFAETDLPTKQTYEQGIEMLRKASLFETNERLEMFAVKKDGAGQWLKIPEDERVHASTHSSISNKILEAAINDKDTERVDIVHTHPLKSISRDPALVSRIQRGETEPPAMPPSMTDILDMMIGSGERYKKLRTVVVDPAGVWGAEVADNPESLSLIKRLREESKSLMNELVEQEDSKEIIKESKTFGEHPSLIFLKFQAAKSKLSPKTNKIISEISEKFQELAKNKEWVDFQTKVEFVSGGHSVLTDEKKLEEIKTLYRGIGVNLTFTPHSRANYK